MNTTPFQPLLVTFFRCEFVIKDEKREGFIYQMLSSRVIYIERHNQVTL